MKETDIEILRQIVSRTDKTGNEKVEMLVEFVEKQLKNCNLPHVSVAKHPLPRPLEAWKQAREMELSDYIEWHLEQERRGNAR